MTNFAVFIFSTSQYCLKVFTVKAYIEFVRQKWFLTVNWLWIAVDKMGIITKLAVFSPCLYFYSMRKAVRVILIVGFLSGVSLLLVGWQHPIFFKWLSGTARSIGKPIKVDVYLNDTLNENISVFKADSSTGMAQQQSVTCSTSLHLVRYQGQRSLVCLKVD